MRGLFTTVLFILSISGTTVGQSQTEMNLEAAESYKKADNELNAVYQQIIKEYSGDSVFLKALRTSQRNWVMFRDSEVKMKYPDREPGWYGSIHPMCISSYMAELTKERTLKLRKWLKRTEEGDPCAGSIWPER